MKLTNICALFLLMFASSEAFAAECPTHAQLEAVCNSPHDIQHVINTHCRTPGHGPEQFSVHYCNNLVNACKAATERPDARYTNNCYKRGEPGEIVGYLPDGNPTNCYQVNFYSSGFGKMTIQTMYPVRNQYCNQH